MKVKVQLDRRYAEPEAAIYTAAMTGEVQQAVRLLSEESPQMLACCDGESVVLVEQTQLVRVYGAAKKVYAQTTQGEFLLRRRLYELEQILDRRYFVRISKSEIVNLRFVRRNFFLFRLLLLRVILMDGRVRFGRSAGTDGQNHDCE